MWGYNYWGDNRLLPRTFGEKLLYPLKSSQSIFIYCAKILLSVSFLNTLSLEYGHTFQVKINTCNNLFNNDLKESYYSDSNQNRIYYRKTGQSNDIFLLIHGLGESHKSLQSMENELLKKGYSVLIVDLLGHGRNIDQVTTPIPSKITIDEQVLLLKKLLTDLNIHQLHLIGHSYGGGVAIKLAMELKGQVQSLTLLATLIQRLDDFYFDPLWDFKNQSNWNYFGWWDIFVNYWTDPLIEAHALDSYKKYFSKKYPNDSQKANRAAHYALAITRGIDKFNILKSVEKIPKDIQILILSAASDNLSPEKLNTSLFSKLRMQGYDVDYILLEGVDHTFPETHPKNVVFYVEENVKN